MMAAFRPSKSCPFFFDISDIPVSYIQILYEYSDRQVLLTAEEHWCQQLSDLSSHAFPVLYLYCCMRMIKYIQISQDNSEVLCEALVAQQQGALIICIGAAFRLSVHDACR